MSDFLKKKGQKSGLQIAREILPMQGPQGIMPTAGVKNTKFQSNNNTKAAVKTSIPQGKAHAKVMGAAANLKHGKYL